MGNLSKTHNVTEIPKGLGRRNAPIKDKNQETPNKLCKAWPKYSMVRGEQLSNLFNICNYIFLYGIFFDWYLKNSFCMFRLKEAGLPNNTLNIYLGRPVSPNSNKQKLLLEIT